MKPNLEYWQTGIIYQIYLKSFYDNNGDGVGDIRGVIEKIDYLKMLGVNIIYLSPFYPNGDRDNGYDVTSFAGVGSEFGSMDDFDDLVENLHKNDMYIAIDIIPNHTSDRHEWFIKSCESDSIDNPYRDYYVWYPSEDRNNPPNNWVPVIGESAWTYNEKRRAWYYHSFLPEQPDLNLRCPQVREEIKKVFSFWLELKKVDGIRIDAVKHLFEDESFKDEPKSKKEVQYEPNQKYWSLDHIYTLNLDEDYKILTEWRALVDEISKRSNRSKFLFVESYEIPKEQAKYFHYDDKPAANFPLNFQFINLCENTRISLANIRSAAKFEPITLKNLINEWLECSKTKYFWSNWELGNHDCARVASRIGKENVKLANALCLLLGGTPITYYGEEIGMENLDYDSISFENCQDHFSKSFGTENYKNYCRDYCRSPMQWDDSLNSGFTKQNKKTWIPVHPDYEFVNVKCQLDDPKSPLRVYIELVKLRQKASFQWGDFQYAIVDEHIFSFTRCAPGEEPSFLVAMNLSNEDITANIFSSKIVASEVDVVYYFDNNEESVVDPYEFNQEISTKTVFLPAKSCLIGSYLS